MLPYSDDAKNLTLGHYHHYKGGEYDVLFIGRLVETDTPEEVVVYQDRNDRDLIWVQSVARFLEPANGVPRFAKIS